MMAGIDEAWAWNFTMEVGPATATMARVVGVGVGTDPTPFQTHGRQAFLRGGPADDAEQSDLLHGDVEPGRWAIVARYRRRRWEVIVEPDADARVLVVVTAYPIEGK
jgi:hypothetical protein